MITLTNITGQVNNCRVFVFIFVCAFERRDAFSKTIQFFFLMKTFKKTFKINAEPSDVYSAITNPYTIELWSGYPAEMSTEPGSEFALWEGDITGKNLEFIQDKKIVQEWYFGEQTEKSIVTITINSERENSAVTVEHTNIPDEEYGGIAEGWKEYYFEAISSFFNPNF
jgi:activator of HSP90 ATPase